MAKVSFTKLGLKVNQDIKTIEFNGQSIEVKQYLPVNEKLELITNVINLAADDNNFVNPVKIDVLTTLEIMYAYTNINFTDKQQENIAKLYDLVISSGLAKEVINAIPGNEYHEILSGVKTSVESIYEYRSSALGVLESISDEYKSTDFDVSQITEKLSNSEDIALLKEIINKLG